MNLYPDNDGRFPEDSLVFTRYPLTDETPPREEWPWVPGIVLGQCGPNEWHIAIDVPELIEHEDGYDWSPACFRDSSELRYRRGN
ncbi:hypothetical protein [Kribbella sp. NPDC051137]|uniref:hypothetical protein n=1 Tax=Kribbella sp. NPDC051137 TaxID=3155045 RepID=UPI00343B288D